MTRFCYVAIFQLLVFAHIKAQDSGNTNLVPPSPEASAIARFGQTPVSLYNGSANINIPLYTLTGRDISVPISLSYNSRGIKVEEEASWVGLGWSLNAGGVITRSIRGIDDFSDGIPGHGFYPSRSGFLYSEPVPSSTDNVSRNLAIDYFEGRQDSNPDIFYYNFNGYSGKFILKQKAAPATQTDPIEVIMLSDDKMKISYDEINRVWEFLTPDGTSYQFGTAEYTKTWAGKGRNSVKLDLTRQIPDPTEPQKITAWYLDKITSQKGEVISFNYTSIEDDYSSSVYSFSEQFTMDFNPSAFDDCNTETEFDPTGTMTGTILRYLKSIKIRTDHSPVGQPITIFFHTEDRDDIRPYDDRVTVHGKPQKLTKMTVKALHNGNMELIKDVRFNYSTRTTGVSTSIEFPEMGKRLQLENVGFYEGNNSIGKYDFDYNSQELPHKNSHEIDYWGYFNDSGPAAKNSKLPQTSLQYYDDFGNIDTYTIPGTDRSADEVATKAGILEKITYPTGGYTSFEYEINEFYDNSLESFGGVVSKTINVNQAGEGTKVFEITKPVEATIYSSIKHSLMSCYGSETDPPFPTNNFPTVDATRISLAGSGAIIAGLHYSMLYCVAGPSDPSCPNIEQIGNGPCGIQRTQQVTLEPGIYVVSVDDREVWNAEIRIAFEHPILVTDDPGVGIGIGGGLRIKRMIDHDGISADNDVVRSYDYTINNAAGQVIPSGKLITIPQHSFVSQSMVARRVELQKNVVWYFDVCMDYTLVSYSTRPFSNAASGASIGYSKVTETLGRYGEGGKTEYRYINFPDLETTSTEMDFMPNAPTTNYDYKNGSLLSEVQYDWNGRPVLKIENDYEETDYGSESYLHWYSTAGNTSPGGDFGPVSFHSIELLFHKLYKIHDVFHRKTTSTKTEYFYENDVQTSHISKTSFFYNMATRLLTGREIGDALESSNANDKIGNQTLFAADLSVEGAVLRDRHMHNLPVETNSFLNDVKVGGMRYVYTEHEDKGGMVLLDEIEHYNTASGTYELRTSLIYDDFGNVIEVNNDGKVTSFLYDDRHALVIASGNNVAHADLTTAYDAEVDNLQTYFEDGLVSEFVHLPYVGLKEVTEGSGLRQQFEFDGAGRLVSINDQAGNPLYKFTYNYQNK